MHFSVNSSQKSPGRCDERTVLHVYQSDESTADQYHKGKCKGKKRKYTETCDRPLCVALGLKRKKEFAHLFSYSFSDLLRDRANDQFIYTVLSL